MCWIHYLFIIYTYNITALNTHRQYGINNANIAKSVEKLSSGYRINRAGDDAAGLAISEKMRAQIRGLSMASKNSQDAISMVQTAEGALQESHNILQRMRELSVQSASDTNETTIDRDALNKEFQALKAEIDDTAAKTKFNDMGLIDGTYSSNIISTATTSSSFSSVWASTSSLPDGINSQDFVIAYKKVVKQAKVDGVKAEIGTAASDLKVEADGAAITNVDFKLNDTDALKDASLNGEWTFGFDSSSKMYTATNSNTGEVRTAAAEAITTGTNEIDFGFGTVTFESDADVNASEVKNFGGKVTLNKGVTAAEEVAEDHLTLNGESVKVSAGQNTVMFQNSGLSVKLASSYTAGDATVGGTITVTRSSAKDFIVQTGANQYDSLAVSIDKMDAQTLGVGSAGIANRLDAETAISQVNTAINLVSTQRADLGALQNRLNHKIANLDTSAENLQAAESRIRDVDMAKEMTNFTKQNILAQAATAMLAQANALPQSVLQLLG